MDAAAGGGAVTSLSALTYYTNDSMRRFIDRYERALETRKKTQVNGWSHVRSLFFILPFSRLLIQMSDTCNDSIKKKKNAR